MSTWSVPGGADPLPDWTVKEFIEEVGTNSEAVTEREGCDLTVLGTNSLADASSKDEFEATEVSE